MIWLKKLLRIFRSEVGAIATKHTPLDQWVASEKTISVTAQTATTGWQNLGTNTTWEVRAKLKITTPGAGTTYALQLADDSSGTNIVQIDGPTASLTVSGLYYLAGAFDTAKQFVRVLISGGAPTFDVDFHAKQVS